MSRLSPAPRPALFSMQASTHQRQFVPLMGAVVLLMVLLTMGAALATVGRAAVASLAMVPASAQMVLRFAPTAGQLVRLQMLRERLETIPEVRTALVRAEQGSAGSGGPSLQADVLPWLGSEMTLATWEGAAGPNSPNLVVLLATRDIRASDRFIDRVRAEAELAGEPMEKRAFAKVTYYTLPDGPAISSLHNFVIIASGNDAMREVIGLGRNRGKGLAEQPDYLELLSHLPAERLGDFYVGPGAAMPVPSPELAAVRGTAVGLSLTPNGLAVDSAARFDLTQLSAASRTLLLQGANPLRSLGAMPDETVAALAIRDLRTIWAAAVAPLRGDDEFEESLASFERSTGLQLEEDIINWMDGEIGLAAVEEPGLSPTTGLPVGALLVIEASNRPLVEAKVARIEEALTGQGLTFTERQVDGVSMRVVEGGSELRGAGYGFAGNFLVVGTSLATLGQAAGVGAGALPSSPRFEAVRAALPSAVPDLFYLDVASVRRMAAAVAQAQGQTASYRQVEPWVRPIAALGSANAVTTADGLARSRLFVLLDLENLGEPRLGAPPVATLVAPAADDYLIATVMGWARQQNDWATLSTRVLAPGPFGARLSRVEPDRDLLYGTWLRATPFLSGKE